MSQSVHESSRAFVKSTGAFSFFPQKCPSFGELLDNLNKTKLHVSSSYLTYLQDVQNWHFFLPGIWHRQSSWGQERTMGLLGGSKLSASFDQLLRLNNLTTKMTTRRRLYSVVSTRMKKKKGLVESVVWKPVLWRRLSTGPGRARIPRD